MSEGFDIHQQFKIINNEKLNGRDYELLTQIYLPLIGLDAFGLYHSLLSLPENEDFTHKVLYDMMALSNLNVLINAKNKLEAIGLVDTYFHNSGRYIYVINRPLSIEEFCDDILLSNLLLSHIGEDSFKRIIKTSKRPLGGYKNITKKFDEVFECDESNIDLLDKFISDRFSKGIQFINEDFDFLIFKELLGDHFFDKELLDDREFKENILRISYLYKLNEDDMKEAIIQTITIDEDLSYSDLSKNARIIFQNKNKSKKNPKISVKTTDPFQRNESDTKHDKLIEALDTTHPTKLLQILSGIKPAVSEVRIIEDLLANTNFPVGVINVMILLVNYEKQGELPSYNYFEKIANTWARADVKSTADALVYINKSYEKKIEKFSSKPYYPRRKKETEVPDWYESYELELQNYIKPQPEELSEEEREQIIQDAKKIFS